MIRDTEWPLYALIGNAKHTTPSDFGMGNYVVPENPLLFGDNYTTKANSKLAGILYNDPTWGPKYRERVKSLIGPGKPFDPAAINQHLDRLHAVLKPAVTGKNLILSICASNLTKAQFAFYGCTPKPMNIYQQSPDVFSKAVATIKTWVERRPEALLAGECDECVPCTRLCASMYTVLRMSHVCA